MSERFDLVIIGAGEAGQAGQAGEAAAFSVPGT
jgi:pyruvate/2-oxoglutarate dehydrogenase complex dihydrolipoamide dehydrogenase (E3) component